MIRLFMKRSAYFTEFSDFWSDFWDYSLRRLDRVYRWFEGRKQSIVDVLYRKRGKYARPFVHAGMVGMLFIGVTVGPAILEGRDDAVLLSDLPQAKVLGLSTEDTFSMGTQTQSGEGVLQFRGGEVVEYEVQSGETLSQIAERYNLSVDTVLWANGLDSKTATIREGQKLKILPVDGVMHKVKKGETVYSIAKKFATDAQAVVDYPFNDFTDDETFALAVGQTLMLPDGVMPKAKPVSPRTSIAASLTPDAGAVSATGRFVWPASGRISQGYRWYHKAVDIANKGGGPILAADAGQVIVAGWPSNEGYGNRVVIDHGNGYKTLYAHLSKISVTPGQRVNRGDTVGMMGSTGRSTGTHLHFEIRAAGVLQNPLNFLR